MRREKAPDNFSQCRKCGARILFVRMKSGKSMPVNPNFVNFRRDGGKDRIVLANGEVTSGTIVTDPGEAQGFGYVSHFATCEYAQTFRRKIVKVPKAGPFTVRFKAKCGEGQTSRIRIYFAGTNKYTDAGSVTETYKTFELEFNNVTANSWYFYVYNYTSGTKVYITDIEILGYISGYSESQLQVLKDSIESEVSRATAGEEKLSSSIKQNATAITSKVSKGEMGSYITQYYNNVIIAFNKNSKYVQINPGEIAIYNYGVENSKKRAVFDETGNHFYRDGYYVGAIGTNQWAGNNAHKGLVFDLEPQGKYMAFAQKASSSATSYTTMLCFSRANSIYDEYGVNLGCNLIGNWYTLKNFKIGSISAGGYTAFSGAIPIVCEITNNGNSWTYSHLRVYNGIIVGYWN